MPQHLVRTVEERVDRDGKIVSPLDEDGVRSAARYFREYGVEAIAVNYMFSFLNSTHERRTRDILNEELPGLFVTISSDVLPQVQEAGVLCVMGAYNKFRGQYCSQNQYLLNEVLKREWGFRGLVVSDWNATHDTLGQHQRGSDGRRPDSDREHDQE